MSVRKIKKSYLSCTGYFASYKNNNQIAFESVMERDLFMILEFDDNVLKYEEQPIRVYYPYNNKTRRYTPDVLITYKDNSQKLIEVKYASELTTNKTLAEKDNEITNLLYLSNIIKSKGIFEFIDAFIDKIQVFNQCISVTSMVSWRQEFRFFIKNHFV